MTAMIALLAMLLAWNVPSPMADEGPTIDPHGARTTTDQGSMIDPDGRASH